MTPHDLELLQETIRLADQSRATGNHPFGALIADAEGKIIQSSGNTHSRDGGTGHAELNVVRAAAAKYPPNFLEGCTLYTSVEPCSMCAGGTYWAGIGRLVYGMTEERLAVLTGDNTENLTMSLPCRQVLAAGQRDVVVEGPIPELEEDIARSHKDFWQSHFNPTEHERKNRLLVQSYLSFSQPELPTWRLLRTL